VSGGMQRLVGGAINACVELQCHWESVGFSPRIC
jgi:hypothetical protein